MRPDGKISKRVAEWLKEAYHIEGTAGGKHTTAGKVSLVSPSMITWQPNHPFKIDTIGSYAAGWSATVNEGQGSNLAGRIWPYNTALTLGATPVTAITAVPSGVGASPVTAYCYVYGKYPTTSWAPAVGNIGMMMNNDPNIGQLSRLVSGVSAIEFTYPIGHVEFPIALPQTHTPPRIGTYFNCYPPKTVQYQTEDIRFNFGIGSGGSGGISPVKLTSKVDDTTYLGDVYGNGTDAAATETGVTIKVEEIAAGETVRLGIRFSAHKQKWSGVDQWTLTEVPRAT